MDTEIRPFNGLRRAGWRLDRGVFWLRAALLGAAVVMLGVIPVVAAHRYRWALWLAPMPPINTPAELIGIVLFLPDLWAAGLLVIALLRLLITPSAAAAFYDTVEQIIVRRGGVWWIALVVWMGVGTLWAGSPALAQFDTLHAAALLVLAFILATYVHEGYARPILLICVTGMTLHAILALAQFQHGNAVGLTALDEAQIPLLSTHNFRAYGLTDNPNSLGGYLLVGLFAALALATGWRGRRWVVIPLWASAALIGAGLVVTFSRGAVGAALLSLLPLIALGARRLRFRARPWAVGLLAAIFAGLLIAAVVTLRERIQARLDETLGTSGHVSGEGFFLNRNFYTADTSAVIRRHSPLLGVGSNNLMREISFINTTPFYDRRYPVHNVYWVIRAENGIPGLVLFGLGCASVLWGLRRTRSSSFIWACAFAGVCLVMLVEFYFWSSHHSRVLLFFVLGMYWGSSLDKKTAEAQNAAAMTDPCIGNSI